MFVKIIKRDDKILDVIIILNNVIGLTQAYVIYKFCPDRLGADIKMVRKQLCFVSIVWFLVCGYDNDVKK